MAASTATMQEGDKFHAKPVPGDSGLPLVGYTFHSMANPIGFTHKRYEQFGEISWCNMFGTRMISMLGPDANQFVFQNRGDMFSNNQGWDFFIGKFFHRGIMLLDFEEHRHHRRIPGAHVRRKQAPPAVLPQDWPRRTGLRPRRAGEPGAAGGRATGRMRGRVRAGWQAALPAESTTDSRST